MLFASLIADSSSAPTEPLSRGTPGVKDFGVKVLSKSTTINNCQNDTTIHEEPAVLLEALIGDQPKMGKTLFQRVLEDGVAFWSFMVEGTTKSCDLLLRMRVERQGEDRTVVRVESVEEEGESPEERLK